MPLLTNPNELDHNAPIAGLINGQPGVGKTTMLLSAPNTVLIDADRGLHRVQKRFHVPSLQMASYKQLLELIESNELDPFDNIAIDTIGQLLDRIADYVCEQEPKNRKRDGSLSLPGYGALGAEFKRFVRIIKDKGKNLFFGAHEKEEKDGENRVVRIDSPGSSAKDLVKWLDFMGYMEMHGDKRTISFSPTEKYYAKNSLGLAPVIDVPDPEKVGNTFLQKNIIEKAAERRKQDAEESKRYDVLVESLEKAIATVKEPKTADEALIVVNAAEVIWDSKRRAQNLLVEKTKGLGMSFDKVGKVFVYDKKPKAEKENAVPANPIAA